MIFVLLAGLALRLAGAWHFFGTFDVASWLQLFDSWKTDLSPYDAARRYSYSPVWFWVLSAVSRANELLHLPPHFAVKLPLVLADLGIFFLILHLAREAGPRRRLLAGACFFLNPVSILNTAYHGQFDNLAYLFVLGACIPGFSWISFALAAAVKHSTLLLAPVFAFREKTPFKKILFFAAAPMIFFASLSFYFLRQDPQMFQNVFADSANLRLVPGAWGWSLVARYVLSFLWAVDIQSDPRYAFLYSLNYCLYPLLFALAYSLAKKRDLIDSVLVYLLFFYTFTVQMAPQYTVWILPFAALRPGRYFYLYTAVTTVHLLAFYAWGTGQHTGSVIVVFRMLAWGVTVLWLGSELRKTSQKPAAV